MFDYIRKDQYFNWVEKFSDLRSAYASSTIYNLKDIQDHFALSQLASLSGAKILEIGGADCRVLRHVGVQNQCWNAEKYGGAAQGPKKQISVPGVRNIPVFLGEFSKDLPDAYFDAVFSISVVEHVQEKELQAFFRDIARVLKSGGRTFHAIDVYVFDVGRMDEPFAKYTRRRLESYLSVPSLTDGDLRFSQGPRADAAPVFSCEYASNADREMMAWNRVVPALTPVRAIAQSVSLMAEWRRT